jgi:hypothetical protein
LTEDIMQRWIALWLASLAVVAGLTSALMGAQAPSQVPPPFTSQAPLADARVVSGADLGFRVESVGRTGEPIGTLMIRVKGEWVPVSFSAAVRPAH